MHITLTDITEYKRAEEALRETEMRHAQALALAGLGTWLWNIETGHFDFSASWAEMRGYRLEEIEPDISVWKNGIHPDDLPVMREKLAEHFAGTHPIFSGRIPRSYQIGIVEMDIGSRHGNRARCRRKSPAYGRHRDRDYRA